MSLIGIDGFSDVGKRRTLNEDSFLIIDLAEAGNIGNEPIYLLAVADGMGGHFGGDLASKAAIDILKETFLNEINSLTQSGFAKDMVLNLLKIGYQKANNSVFQASQQENYRMTMGSTLVSAFIADKEVLVANVGDSRAYLLKKGKLKQISQDHSLIKIKADKFKGMEHEVEKTPLRNIITRAIGANSTVKIDTFIERLEDSQFLLLCSDGLYSEVEEEEIEQVFHKAENTKTIAEKLIKMANQKGGSDNITVIVARFAEDVTDKKEEPTKHKHLQPNSKKDLKVKLRIPRIFNRKK